MQFVPFREFKTVSYAVLQCASYEAFVKAETHLATCRCDTWRGQVAATVRLVFVG